MMPGPSFVSHYIGLEWQVPLSKIFQKQPQVRTLNLGAYSGLSFSVWYKPASGAGPTARIFEFTGSSGQINLGMRRNSSSSKLKVYVRRSASADSSFTAEEGTWQAGVWKHVTWTIAPISSSSSSAALWKLYVDGNMTAMVDGLYPMSGDYDESYIGGAASDSDGGYVGNLDTFFVFSQALFDQEARLVYRVSVCVNVCVRERINKVYERERERETVCMRDCLCVRGSVSVCVSVHIHSYIKYIHTHKHLIDAGTKHM